MGHNISIAWQRFNSQPHNWLLLIIALVLLFSFGPQAGENLRATATTVATALREGTHVVSFLVAQATSDKTIVTAAAIAAPAAPKPDEGLAPIVSLPPPPPMEIAPAAKWANISSKGEEKPLDLLTEAKRSVDPLVRERELTVEGQKVVYRLRPELHALLTYEGAYGVVRPGLQIRVWLDKDTSRVYYPGEEFGPTLRFEASRLE